MPITIKTYRFNPPGPSFSLSLKEKSDYPKTYANIANLDDYPLEHEVIGYEIKIEYPMIEHHNTQIRHIYYNDETDEVLFSNTLYVPEPSTAGYTYWNWYRFFSWIGHCNSELNKPMKVRIKIFVTSYAFPNQSFTEYITVGGTTEPPPPPPPPEELPDFWNDPLGWIGGVITGGFEMFINWFGGAFFSWLSGVANYIMNLQLTVIGWVAGIMKDINTWFADRWVDFISFEAWLMAWVTDNVIQTVNVIGDVIGQAWADWLNAFYSWAIGFYDWTVTTFDSVYNTLTSSLNNLWNAISDLWTNGIDWLQSSLNDIWTWIAESSLATVDFITQGFADLWQGITDAVGGAVEWMGTQLDMAMIYLSVYTDNQVGVVQQATTDMGDWFDDAITATNEWFGDQINGLVEWINDFVPELVDSMFEWAKPVIQPIMDAAGFLGQLLGIFSGTAPEDPRIKAHKEHEKEIRERIRKLMEEI